MTKIPCIRCKGDYIVVSEISAITCEGCKYTFYLKCGATIVYEDSYEDNITGQVDMYFGG